MSSNSKSSLALGMTLLADSVNAALSVVRPWSTSSVEARRLALDGYPKGSLADIYYLVSFDETPPDAALAALRGAGFSVRDPASHSGFLTVKTRIRMGAFDLTLASARLDRIVDEFSGFATLIGAGRATSDEPARAVAKSTQRVAAI